MTRDEVMGVLNGYDAERIVLMAAELPELDQRVILLRYVEHLTWKEIAGRMFYSKAGVSYIWRRALGRLEKSNRF